jgi:processive 1,2-diacylglycerol beta-glucosyltransferase
VGKPAVPTVEPRGPTPGTPTPGRVLIVSAAIGEGHDLPARVLADDIRAESPGTEVVIADGLAAMGWGLDSLAQKGSPFFSRWGNLLFDLEYWLLVEFPPTRALAGAFLHAVGARGLLRLISAERPDVVVSTYPGVTEVLGRMRRRGRLAVPAVSAITDLAALRYWSHPGVDLHLVTHPESVEEVRRIAGDREVLPVRGLNSPHFASSADGGEAARRLGLPSGRKIVVISGGGWAVGDLEGAVEATLALPGTFAVVLCGRNERILASMRARHGDSDRVRVLGFTDRMSDLLAAADALVHSTAGLTVLEAHIRGCPAISYGWGRAHIRANNRAFVRHDLAQVATTREELSAALERALERRREPDLSFSSLPTAASAVLGLLASQQLGNGG